MSTTQTDKVMLLFLWLAVTKGIQPIKICTKYHHRFSSGTSAGRADSQLGPVHQNHGWENSVFVWCTQNSFH